jgi:TPR repeat protein
MTKDTACPDYAEARRWYRKAAEQEDADAQFNLGMMYAAEHGVPQDYVQSHMWLNLAASRGGGDDQKKFAHERDSLARKMTAQQVAEAQRLALARAWKPKTSDRGGPGKVNVYFDSS